MLINKNRQTHRSAATKNIQYPILNFFVYIALYTINKAQYHPLIHFYKSEVAFIP